MRTVSLRGGRLGLAALVIAVFSCIAISRAEAGEAARGGARGAAADLPAGKFAWTAGPALIGTADQAVVSIKDPSVVYAGGRWAVYATIRYQSSDRPTCMEALSFADWGKADAAPRHVISLVDAYHCAPQVFYFTPKHQWYLLYQSTDKSVNPPNFGPALSTLEDPAKPETLSKPAMLFVKKPENVKGWIDFWIICDAEKAHLFFTSNDGRMWRCATALGDFPAGWSRPEVVLTGDIFEASHTYRLKGLNKYLTIIEAQGGGGSRYYKAYLADRLDGEWRPLAASAEKPFASMKNVKFEAGVAPWTDSISHGELLREGVDETMTVDPGNLRFLFQGCTAAERAGKGYGMFPWRLGILTSVR